MNNLADKLILNYDKFPEKIILIQDERKYTYSDLYLRVILLKNYLRDNGLKENSKILILQTMSIELYIILLAIWSIGAIPCFMDAGFIKNNINNNEFEEINAIIGNTKYLLYSNINKNLNKLKIKINSNIIEKLAKNETLTSILGKEELEITEVEKDYPAIYTYTSGSTGKPKVISRTHDFLLTQAQILEENLNYEDNDIELSTVPVFTLSNLYYGVTTVIADMNYSNLEKTNGSKLITQIEKNRINRIMCSPGLIRIITDYCIKNNLEISYKTKVFTGGGAVFQDLIEKIKKVFLDTTIFTIYGSSEAEPIAMLDINDMDETDIKETIEGKGILAGKIIGVDDCKTIEIGQEKIGTITKERLSELESPIGEIIVAGKNVLEGYVNGIGDAENKIKVGDVVYHRTGDVGEIDEKGRLWLKGRIKNPYFGIEASLHCQLNIGKTAILKENNKLILVLESSEGISEEKIREAINFINIDKIVYISSIPVDRRHGSKVDYKELLSNLKFNHII